MRYLRSCFEATSGSQIHNAGNSLKHSPLMKAELCGSGAEGLRF